MPSRRKDINEATQQDLEQIPQMSSARAETIVHYRDQHGPFTSMDQISNVPGIGDTMAQQIAEFFSLRSSRSGSRAENDEADDEENGNGEDEEPSTSEDQPRSRRQSAARSKE